MKIKHWQGYGRLDAKVVSRTKDQVVIKIIGEHECGLKINYHDKYTLATWLGRESLGNFKEKDIESYETEILYSETFGEIGIVYYINLK